MRDLGRRGWVALWLGCAACASAGEDASASDPEEPAPSDDGLEPDDEGVEAAAGTARPPVTAGPEPRGVEQADPVPTAPPPPCPDPPVDLVTFLLGDPADADVEPTGPAWLLSGGTPGPAEGLEWWASHAAGGDVVLLRTDHSDLYLQLFWDALQPVDSVELITIASPEQAQLESVVCRLARAEAIYVLGGWQNTYVENWSGSSIPHVIETAWKRGAAIGGNSAGLAVMGEFVFGAHQGTIHSDEALADPYSSKITLDTDFLHLPLGRGVLFDTHFAERDRMGRSFAFLARIIMDGWDADPVAIGIDEDTALLVDAQGLAEVRGSGSVYVMRPPGPPAVCHPELPLEYDDLEVFALPDGAHVWLPDGLTDEPPFTVGAADGMLDPEDPY